MRRSELHKTRFDKLPSALQFSALFKALKRRKRRMEVVSVPQPFVLAFNISFVLLYYRDVPLNRLSLCVCECVHESPVFHRADPAAARQVNETPRLNRSTRSYSGLPDKLR
jgi:hypothetical protein